MASSLLPSALQGLSWQTWLFAIAPATTAAYWLLWVVYTRTLHPLASIPGPFWASVSRTWYMAQIAGGRAEHTQRELHQKFGPLVRIAPNEIAVADPHAIKKIYPLQKPLTKTDFYVVWANGNLSKYPDVFSVTDEALHAERRKIIQPVYTLSNVLKSEQYIDKCSNLFVQRMGEFADSKKSVDFGEWLQMYTFDVVGELYFGSMFGFMENSHDHGGYIASLDALMPPICVAAHTPTYARPFVLGSSAVSATVRAGLQAMEQINVTARECVAKRYEQLKTSKVAPRQDLLQQLIDIANEKGEKVGFGVHEVELDAYVALLAGSDTTAIAMRSVFYHLMKTPTAYAELQAEIDAAQKAGQLSTPIKYSEAIKLPYLCAAIKEGMRLHPSVGLTMPRHVPQGGMELCGKHIPAGWRVGINAAVIHFDKEIFGEDAEDFRPARWLEEGASNMDKYMLHFGAGTRTCIGKNISLSELHKLIPTVLRDFTLEMAHDKPWETHNSWFNKQTNIIVNLRRRI